MIDPPPRADARPTGRVAPLSQLAFACSGMPTAGVIGNGLDYFLFYYYSQVIELPAALTGLALAVSLACAAMADPLVGYLSDHWKSRLGRRHPFMYASIVPMTVLYVAVWFPPFRADSKGPLFAFLLGTLVLLRLSMSLFDVPARTMVAELTHDYDERTRLAALPISLGWFTSSVMTMAMYALWLKGSSTPAGDAAGYQTAALVGGALVLVSLLISTAGLHPEIARLRRTAPPRSPSPGDMWRSFSQLWRNRSLRALLAYGVFAGVGLGITSALWIYQYSSFYGMSSGQMSVLVFAELLASFAAAPVVRRFVVKGEKKTMAMRFLAGYVALSLVLPSLLVSGVLPGRGSQGLLCLLLVYDFSSQVLSIVIASTVYSLFADVTDEVRAGSGQQWEGAIFASQTFIDKSAAAAGGMAAGLLLTAIGFPAGADGAALSEGLRTRLGMGYMISWAVFTAIGIGFLSGYRITRSQARAQAGEPDRLPATTRLARDEALQYSGADRLPGQAERRPAQGMDPR